MVRGKLITIEGLDGAGKTTLTVALAQALSARGIEARVLREPGGVPVAERIRSLVKDPSLEVSARTEALLYAAARAQLIDEAIEPALSGGSWVLLDRFVDSSLAYQGAGRELGVEAVREINDFATAGQRPDRTLLLVVDPAIGRSRSRTRGEPLDRLEREDDPFFARIAEGYRQLAEREPERIRPIAAAQEPSAVLGAALDALADLI